MLTGDEGSMDKDGYLSITGRIKDIIIIGTLNHPPPALFKCFQESFADDRRGKYSTP